MLLSFFSISDRSSSRILICPHCWCAVVGIADTTSFACYVLCLFHNRSSGPSNPSFMPLAPRIPFFFLCRTILLILLLDQRMPSFLALLWLLRLHNLASLTHLQFGLFSLFLYSRCSRIVGVCPYQDGFRSFASHVVFRSSERQTAPLFQIYCLERCFFGSMTVEVPDTDSDSEFETWIM